VADLIYWSDSYQDAIRGAPLAGHGTVDTIVSAAANDNPFGLAIDATAGRIYWASRFGNKIQRAPLAPGGTAETLYDSGDGVSGPSGIAIHPAAGRIYWANSSDDTIRRAPLVPHGTVETLYTGSGEGVQTPTGVAIDPAAGRIYWASAFDNTIRGAPLASHGNVGILYGPPAVSNPGWVAIDAAAGRIYWTYWNYTVGGRICGARLGGGVMRPTIDTLYDSSRGVSYLGGLAIDPNPAEPGPARLEVSRDTESFTTGGWLGRARDWAMDVIPRPTPSPGLIYWGNGRTGGGFGFGGSNPNDQKIRCAPLAGRGTVEDLYSDYAQGVNSPAGLALLRAPLGTVPPVISWQFVFGGAHFPGPPGPDLDHVEQRLACSPGTWAPDLLGSFLYRAPQNFTYQWVRNGTDLTDPPDPTKPSYTPTIAGNYSCRVTATNRAGSATQTSAAFTVTSGMLP
jgi:hypothetical protein